MGIDAERDLRIGMPEPAADRQDVNARGDGIWVEALGDVQVLPATADKVQIIEALAELRAAKLLVGMRGAPPADVTAVAEVVLAIGGLMQSVPEISEIDINPLTVHATA